MSQSLNKIYIHIIFSTKNREDLLPAISVSQSKVDTVTNYIRNQKEHHTKKSFKEELVEFLKNYQIEYKEEYLWS